MVCLESMWFDALVAVAAFAAGAIASVAGFGIGSILTPTFGLAVGTKLAVAAVSIPHVVGTAVRFWTLRDAVSLPVLAGFGVASALGGLTGALLHGMASSRWLAVIFGGLLVLVAGRDLTGMARNLKFRGWVSWMAGALSGLLGGLVGNQGGIRSAALLGFDLPKRSFVATATAVGLIVDGARLPVYLVTEWSSLWSIAALIAVAIAGVVAGTVFGNRVLVHIPESKFRPVVAFILAILGVSMLIKGLGGR